VTKIFLNRRRAHRLQGRVRGGHRVQGTPMHTDDHR